MAQAVICPICGGTGKLPMSYGKRFVTGTTAMSEKECHGCYGRGWVEVGR